uniref:NADH-ubiquinone oxidoreductase chain 1 n=1 Tax=Lingula anatina TaxID=7574 RepID=A0A0R7JPA8_LINAN|nr:NADH dehydrogenase subunit 1 [Lingula anatina]
MNHSCLSNGSCWMRLAPLYLLIWIIPVILGPIYIYLFSFQINLLIIIGFYSLAERAILSLVAGRQSPGVVGFRGVMQPMADGMKLYMKDMIRLSKSNHFAYVVCPSVSMGLSFGAWSCFPFWGTYTIEISALLFLCFVSLSAVPIMVAGWASNSKYSLLASVRALAQAISYEVVLGLLLVFPLLFSKSLEFSSVTGPNQTIWMALAYPPLFGMWLVCILAETNRSPFDLVEAESELVSGYNVEYSGLHFALFFMSEYSNMLLFSVITTALYLNDGWFFFDPQVGEVYFITKAFFVSLFILLCRAVFPRIRFDQLMTLMWKGFLPLTLSFYIWFIVFQ